MMRCKILFIVEPRDEMHYMHAAMEHLGHDVEKVYINDVMKKDVSRYDVIFCVHNFIFASIKCGKRQYIDHVVVNKTGKFVVWCFDLCTPIDKLGTANYQYLKRYIEYIDLLVTTDNNIDWRKLTRRHMHLNQGYLNTDNQLLYKRQYAGDSAAYLVPPQYCDRNYVFDVIFTGRIYSEYRFKQISMLSDRYKLVCYGNNAQHYRRLKNIIGRPQNYSLSMFRDAMVCYVPRYNSDVGLRYWSNRIYQATAAGACCVVEYVNGLEAEFEIGKEIVAVHDDAELVRAIDGLIADSSRRTEIGLAGMHRTISDYSYVERFSKIFENLASV